MKKKFTLIAISLLFSVNTISQDKKNEKKKEKTISELTKSSKKIDGLFTIYQDTVSGKLKMPVSNDQFDKEFIHFSQIADGVTEAGGFRGRYNGGTIFYIKGFLI